MKSFNIFNYFNGRDAIIQNVKTRLLEGCKIRPALVAVVQNRRIRAILISNALIMKLGLFETIRIEYYRMQYAKCYLTSLGMLPYCNYMQIQQ